MIFRKPDVEITVQASKSETAVEAMMKMNRFTALCMKYDLSIVKSVGKDMTLRGRPKKIEKFKAEHQRLSLIGGV